MRAKHIDKTTGEIIHEPDFVKLYIKDLCNVKILSSVQQEIFKFMMSNMDYENLVTYGSSKKKDFLLRTGITSGTFNNNITKLIESELIERVSIGEFRVNKKFAVKVDWSKVQSIKWETTYNKKGKKEKLVIKYDEKDKPEKIIKR